MDIRSKKMIGKMNTTIVILSMLLGISAPVALAQQSGPGVVSPFPGEMPAAVRIVTESDLQLTLGSTGSGFEPAANWLTGQQQGSGCFPWTPGETTCYGNTQGPSGMGMLSAYLHGYRQADLNSALANGNFMVPVYPDTYSDGDPRFATHNPYFLELLSVYTADSSYADFVQTYFWDKLNSGTYGEGNDWDAAEFGDSVVDTRISQGWVEISPWDLSAAAIAAHMAGETASRDALLSKVLRGLEETTGPFTVNDMDVIGVAGAVWASAIIGGDLDPQAGYYAGLDSTDDLVNYLLSMRTTDGAWRWTSAVDDNPANADTQTTAFALRALFAFGGYLTYQTELARGAAYLRNVQDSNGQFLAWPGAAPASAGGVELHAEALTALVEFAPDLVYINDDWLGMTPGDDPDGDSPAVAYGYDAFATVQEGVDAVTPGGTVNVAAGIYVEQVVITKDVSLLGSGVSSVIQAPDLVPVCFSTSYDQHAIVCVKDHANATIDGFTIDGAGKGNANYRFVGIGFHNAWGSVLNNTITDIRDTPFSGAQHGVAIYAYEEDGLSSGITVQYNTITGFQKNAMALNANDTTSLNVTVEHNTIIGAGPTDVTAQNGIQVWADVGSGTIASNTVNDIAYDNTYSSTKWVATSILNFYADLSIIGNSINNAHMGVYNIIGSSEVSGNDLTIAKVGDFAYGIVLTDPPDAKPAPYVENDETLLSPQPARDPQGALGLSTQANYNSLTFSGPDNTYTYGIEADAGYGPEDMSVYVQGNQVSGFDTGISFYQCETGCDTGGFTELSAHGNRITGNTYGMFSNVAYLAADAEWNWWGDASGPYHTTQNSDGTGDEVSDNVDFTPWCVDDVCMHDWPRIEVRAEGPDQNKVGGRGWTTGELVNVKIGDPLTPDSELDVLVETCPGAPEIGCFTADFNPFDILTGDLVTATQGAFSKETTVADLEITDVDPSTNWVYGTSAPNEEIEVWSCTGDTCSDSLMTTANGSGGWNLDLSSVWDIVEGGWVDSSEKDEEEDSTMFGYNVPLPQFQARMSENEVHGYQWPLGNSVSISIDDPDNGVGEDYTETQTVVEATWDPTQTIVQFFLDVGGVFILEPGQKITMFDAETTKVLDSVSTLAVTDFDVDNEIVIGTVESGALVDGYANCTPTGCEASRRVTAVGIDWSMDFNAAPSDPADWGTANLEPGSSGDAITYDADWDGTHVSWSVPTPTHVVADFDNDADTDLSVYKVEPWGGMWYLFSQPSHVWGNSDSIPVACDYNGDGSADVAVYNDGTWYIKDQYVENWGDASSVPVPGDYNGDGNCDLAVYKVEPWGGTWYIKDQGTHSWGNSASIPVPADYNSDGVTDVAVYNDGTWYVEGLFVETWGDASSIPVPGNYDGLGDLDLAVYKVEPWGGTWYIMGDGTYSWGNSASIPVPGDYDGNGSLDVAVYNDGTWYVESQFVENWGDALSFPLPIRDTNGDGDPYQ